MANATPNLDVLAPDMVKSHVTEEVPVSSPYGDAELLVIETFRDIVAAPQGAPTYLVRVRVPGLGYAAGHWVRVDATWRLHDVLGAPLPGHYLRALSLVLERRHRAAHSIDPVKG